MWIDNDFPKLLGAELYRPHRLYHRDGVNLWCMTLPSNPAKLLA